MQGVWKHTFNFSRTSHQLNVILTYLNITCEQLCVIFFKTVKSGPLSVRFRQHPKSIERVL